MSDNKKVKSFLQGAVVGGVIGAVTALLFAPKSGKEVRTDIAEQYHKVSDKTQEIAEQVGSKAKEFGGRTKNIAVQVGSRTKEIAVQVGSKTKDIAGTVSSQASEFASKAKEVTSGIAEELRSWKDSRNGSDDVAATISAVSLESIGNAVTGSSAESTNEELEVVGK